MLRLMLTQTQMQAISVPKLSYSLAEVELASGLSRASIYRAIAAGTLKTVQLGRRRLVPALALADFLQSPVTR